MWWYKGSKRGVSFSLPPSLLKHFRKLHVNLCNIASNSCLRQPVVSQIFILNCCRWLHPGQHHSRSSKTRNGKWWWPGLCSFEEVLPWYCWAAVRNSAKRKPSMSKVCPAYDREHSSLSGPSGQEVGGVQLRAATEPWLCSPELLVRVTGQVWDRR